MTAHCRVSASSTISFSPLAERTARVATITGFSAATSMRAAAATEAESPAGGAIVPTFGMRKSAPPLGTGRTCIGSSMVRTTGIMGGVMASLYARTADSAKRASEAGASSHLVMSRTSAAGSCAACTPPTSLFGSRVFPITM